jgi:hypothetical protein
MTETGTAGSARRIDDLRERTLSHPLYARIASAEAMRAFMRLHVFCVWDFQSLVKALQRQLTCVDVPWLPTSDAGARRLINEIVLDEESDEDGQGGYASHFELYVDAMRECGADTGPIERLTAALREGRGLASALKAARVPPAVEAFVRGTIASAGAPGLHRVCADFTLSREDVIPEMFTRIIAGFPATERAHFSRFIYYLDRHIKTDGERHGPLSRRLLEKLCGDDPVKRDEAQTAARAALERRIALWDEILAVLPSDFGEVKVPQGAGG